MGLTSRLGAGTLKLVSALPAPLLRRALHAAERVPLVSQAVRPLTRRGHGARLRIGHGAATGLSFSPGPGALVYASGRIELPVQQEFARRINVGDTVFDVGANVGFYTLIAARGVGPTGRIVSFEPSPGNLQGLRDNIFANSFENVEIVTKAVSSATGQGVLD